ncbi:MAG: recombination regulator RecX [Lachnospiraceae bacterium]|nr:recombination regulator RecX [Lachnospiraceae bacterium]
MSPSVDKAMRLLTARDYTEQGLRDKLIRSGFSAEDTDEAIEYVRSFGYIDDLRYAMNYARCSVGVRSRRETEHKLLEKGVSSDVISQALLEEYSGDDDEDELIRHLIHKKCRDLSALDFKGRQKLLAYMYNKGFRTDRVNRILEEESLDITS